MAASQKTRGSHKKNSEFGLLANGASGPWEIAIDEALSGPARWRAQIEGPSLTFNFEIASLDMVGEIARFFEARLPESVSNGATQTTSILAIGKDTKPPITLVRDDEYEDRYFFVVGPRSSPIVRYVIFGTDAAKIVEALREVQNDLED
jgi:hypothetical protein